MQKRPIFYTLEQILSGDVLGGMVDALIGDANALQVILGSTGTFISNLVLTPTSPASLTLNLSNGFIAQLEQVDQSTYGSLAANTQQVMQLGFNNQNSVLLSNSGLSAGQAQYVLIEAGYVQEDSDSTVLPYVNLSNPAVPLNGPGNSGIAQDTVRNAICNIQVKYGTPATAGSEVPPAPDAGYVAVALIDLAHGQVTITSGEILDPASVVGYTHAAPVLAGLLNKHHTGVPGQAPQIDLTSEVQNELPMANLVASNTVGGVTAFRQGSGNPNGVIAGNSNRNNVPDTYYDYTNNLWYVCTTTGNSMTAVWTAINVTTPLPSNIIYFGTGSNPISNPAPTSGTLTGEYYTPGNWTQTGALTLNNCRLLFGGSATFNNTVTVSTELPGGTNITTAGASGPGAGIGGGGPAYTDSSSLMCGGGGGGHGGKGGGGAVTIAGVSGQATTAPNGGAAYAVHTLMTGSGGSGGAASGENGALAGDGGAGGGSLYIEAVGNIHFTSACTMTLNGAQGGDQTGADGCGGGGGSGGGLYCRTFGSVLIDSGATINANGGRGGNGGTTGTYGGRGGGGGGGGIMSFYGNGSSVNNGTCTVSGGAAGTASDTVSGGNGAAGSTGTVGFNTTVLGRRLPS